jgi:hypothetical protein
MTTTRKKSAPSKPIETSPARLLGLELEDLRRDLRATVRAYSARLEIGLAETRAALESAKSGNLSHERIHQLRDLTILVRKRKLKPEKGRKKDLRKIDSLIEELQQLLVPTTNKL